MYTPEQFYEKFKLFALCRYDYIDSVPQQAVVTYYNPCSSALAKLEELTDDEKAKGIFSRKIPDDAANFKVYFENKYGIWTHTMIKI